MSQTKAELINAKGGADLGALNISGSAPDNSINVDSSGRLLVGTSSVYSDYVGVDSGFTGISSFVRNTGDGVVQFQNWASSVGLDAAGGTSIFISRCKSGTIGTHAGGALASGNPIGRIVFNTSDGTNFRSSAYITAEVDGGVSAGDVPGRLVFSTTADGASSPTERLRITSTGQVRLAGAGITFNGDTATANELDDYEEGTFTPTVIGLTTAGTATYTTQVGRYTKIGRIVQFEIYIWWSSGTGTGGLAIAGLPFTCNNASTFPPVTIGLLEGLALSASNYPNAYIQNNTTRIYVRQSPVGGGADSAVNYDAAASLLFSGCYSV